MTDEPGPQDASRQARVVVVGGGFSGTMTAANLARLADHPARPRAQRRRGRTDTARVHAV